MCDLFHYEIQTGTLIGWSVHLQSIECILNPILILKVMFCLSSWHTIKNLRGMWEAVSNTESEQEETV